MLFRLNPKAVDEDLRTRNLYTNSWQGPVLFTQETADLDIRSAPVLQTNSYCVAGQHRDQHIIWIYVILMFHAMYTSTH